MDRRKSLKSIIFGGVATGLAAHGCKPDLISADNEITESPKYTYGRTPEEEAHDDELLGETFFNAHEMETIALLCDLILPADQDQGLQSATDANVPEFIEFMSKDIPEMQIPLRGGLMWLDHRCNVDHNTPFKLATLEQQEALLDTIAYPDPVIPDEEQPLEIQFFSLVRNLTLTGYYTSKIGIEELGYQGNTPNVWDGVPDDILAQHGISYDEEWLAKCVDQSQRNTTAEWDQDGNLLT